MIFTVFYNPKDFFGNTEFNKMDYCFAYSETSVKAYTKKCMAAFGKFWGFSFRAESGDAFYLIEQSAADKEGCVYTVTHRISAVNVETPVKMSAAAIRKIIIEMYRTEAAQDCAA